MTDHLDIHKNPSLYYDDRRSDLGRRILDALNRMHDYDLEELLHDLPFYTWNQVFLEVDRMSRNGELRLFLRGPGQYAVSLPLQTSPQHSEERLLVNM